MKITQEIAERRYTEANLELLGQYINTTTKLKAKCFCGNIFMSIPNNIFSGHKKSCNCLNGKHISLRKLTQQEVEKRFKEKNLMLLSSYVSVFEKVNIKCYCNKEFIGVPGHIFSGHTKSCGCAHKINGIKKRKIKIGDKFKKLTVINFHKKTSINNNRKLYWLCKCECGITKSINARSLLNGDTKSCGNCKLYRNGKRISYLQLDLHKMIGKGVLNFKSGKYFIDIALVMNGKKIAIEYDCWHWHKRNIEHDKIRTKWLLDHGWLVLSVKSNKELLTLNQLQESLKNFLNNQISYQEIILSDWGIK